MSSPPPLPPAPPLVTPAVAEPEVEVASRVATQVLVLADDADHVVDQALEAGGGGGVSECGRCEVVSSRV